MDASLIFWLIVLLAFSTPSIVSPFIHYAEVSPTIGWGRSQHEEQPHWTLATRRLTQSHPSVTTALTRFRVIEGKGMRGFLEGGKFSNSTPLSCAQQCISDYQCLSFDFATLTRICYISHSDRYTHPEAFLDFPTDGYYEWQGVVNEPELEPNGGYYTTQVAVRLITTKLGATIRFRIFASTTVWTTSPNATELFHKDPQDYNVTQSGQVIILPAYSCRIYAIAVKDGMNDSSLVISDEYKIYASKYAYLIPSFNGDFHGRVVRIQLDIVGKKRPRPARFQEFSDYETTMGLGPYSTQVSVINTTTLNPEYRGFSSAFMAFSNTSYVNETYLVTIAGSTNYYTTTWRLVLEAQYAAHATHVGFGSPARVVQSAEYLYLMPFYNGVSFSGTVIRVLTSTFNSTTPYIQTLNLTAINATLKGFSASFTDSTNYAYFVPQKNDNGLFGKLVRLNLNDFTSTGVAVLDLAAIHPSYVGFSHGFVYGNHSYLVPFYRPLTIEEQTTNMREFPVSNSGLVVRVDLRTFTRVASLDLSKIHPDLAGFSGAVRVTHFAYFVPYMRVMEAASIEVNPYSGLLARVNLRDFRSVEYLNLTQVHVQLRGFVRGFAYKQYVYLVPHRSQFGSGDISNKSIAQSGLVARIDTNDFSPTGVSYLDLATTARSQVPDLADSDLRGFMGGVVSGKYGFFIPYFDGHTFSGKVCRINLDNFQEVQALDLTQLDDNLRGFAGAVVSKVEETLETDLFADFEMRAGTTTPYQYTY